jgi:hypothetical protein
VDVDGGGGKLVVDRRSLGGGGGTPAIRVRAFTAWTIGSRYGPVAGVKANLSPVSLQSQAVRESPEEICCNSTHVAVFCTVGVINDRARVFSST